MTIETIMLDGRKRVVMDPEDHEDLVDARDLALAMPLDPTS